MELHSIVERFRYFSPIGYYHYYYLLLAAHVVEIFLNTIEDGLDVRVVPPEERQPGVFVGVDTRTQLGFHTDFQFVEFVD